jgi:hypothetical protein
MADTVKEMAQYLGRSGCYRVQGMEVAVEVTDARVTFGQVHLQIRPVSGTGSQWVARDSVQIPIEREEN